MMIFLLRMTLDTSKRKYLLNALKWIERSLPVHEDLVNIQMFAPLWHKMRGRRLEPEVTEDRHLALYCSSM